MKKSADDSFLLRAKWGISLLMMYYGTGVFLFRLLERQAELDMYAQNRSLYAQMKKLYSFQYCEDESFKTLSFCKSQHAFGRALVDYFNSRGPNSLEDNGNWSVLGTVFFLTSLSTTIGYGHSHPITSAGQLLCVFFALFGLPLMAYNLALVAEMWMKLATLAGIRLDTKGKRVALLVVVLWLFLFGGAYCFSILEDWSYLESLYFCFVTLSTVGFGDYLPGSALSRAFSILYMILGLGVCASLIATLTGFVSDTQNVLDGLIKAPLDRIQENCCNPREDKMKMSLVGKK